MTRLSQQLKDYRKKNGISQFKLGKILGIKQQVISLYENDDAEPMYYRGLEILSKLGIVDDTEYTGQGC